MGAAPTGTAGFSALVFTRSEKNAELLSYAILRLTACANFAASPYSVRQNIQSIQRVRGTSDSRGMKKFRFQFETLERVRRSREDEALRLLSTSQSAFRTAQEHKLSLLRNLDESFARRESLADQPIGVLSFQLENDFISGTKQRVIQSDQAILRAKRGVERALRVYLTARRQTKMMEMLREKAFTEYKTDRNKLEQKQLDDLSVMRARFRETA